MDKKLFIVPFALLALVAGYMGLASYASSKAEKQLEDWLYDNKLEDAIQWKKLSASPLGGSITLEGVRFNQALPLGKNIDVDVDKVRISDFANDRDLKSAKLELNGIRQAGDNLGPFGLFLELSQNSGRAEIQPFDVSLAAQYNQEARHAKVSYSLNVPELFASQGSIQLNNARNLDRLMDELAGLTTLAAAPTPLAMAGLQKQLQALESIELGETHFELNDLGYFKRTAALNKRYTYALIPGKGSADEQRSTIEERLRRHDIDQCIADLNTATKDANELCTGLIDLIGGNGNGIALRIKPERMRLSNLSLLADSGGKGMVRMVKNLNLEAEKL